MGKSTAMKHYSHCWADGSVEQLKQFDFVFHLALKSITGNEGIEYLIKEQHTALCGNNVQPEEIRAIIEGETKQKVLLLLDGHDEYKPGTNSHIDRAIAKYHLRNCWIVITSRETTKLAEIRECIDAEAKITGFDKERIEEYITKYLGSHEKCMELLAKTEHTVLHDSLLESTILCIPILLHMICFLFGRHISLPTTKTGIFPRLRRDVQIGMKSGQQGRKQ